jgi:hypothetical protein
LVLDCEGIDALRPHVAEAMLGPELGVPCAAVAAFLLDLRSRWCAEAASDLLDRAVARLPNRIALVSMRARCHVVLGEAEQAARLIESIPALCGPADVHSLRAWLAARRGEAPAARAHFELAAKLQASRAIYGREPPLERLTAGPEAGKSPRLVTFLPVRDEIVMAPLCLEHHRALGVEHFVCIDNGSSDGTAEWLARQPDVTLYRCITPFHETAACMRVVNALAQRHAAAGWSLYVDADERFTYPSCEKLRLPDLVTHLEEEGAEGMAAFMLDLFPARLFDQTGRPASLSEFVWHDTNYDWMEVVSSPYSCPAGGLRTRVFGAQEHLQKAPLVRVDRGAYLSAHETTVARMASVSGVLLHYKLFTMAQMYRPDELGEDGNPFVVGDRSANFKRRAARYLTGMETLRDVDLRHPEVSVRIGDSQTLVGLGLMRAPEAFLTRAGAS